VQYSPMYNRQEYSARRSGGACWRGRNGRKLVPEEVVDVIHEIKGVERLKAVALKGDIEDVIAERP